MYTEHKQPHTLGHITCPLFQTPHWLPISLSVNPTLPGLHGAHSFLGLRSQHPLPFSLRSGHIILLPRFLNTFLNHALHQCLCICSCLEWTGHGHFFRFNCPLIRDDFSKHPFETTPHILYPSYPALFFFSTLYADLFISISHHTSPMRTGKLGAGDVTGRLPSCLLHLIRHTFLSPDVELTPAFTHLVPKVPISTQLPGPVNLHFLL